MAIDLNEKAISDEEFSELVKQHGSEVEELVKGLMYKIPPHKASILPGCYEYTIDTFKRERHARVKSQDKYRLYSDLYGTKKKLSREERGYYGGAYCWEKTKLTNSFSALEENEFPEEWKQKIIIYVYQRLIYGLNKDFGLGNVVDAGSEDVPITMWIEESILADQILEKVKTYEEYYREELATASDAPNPNSVIDQEIIDLHEANRSKVRPEDYPQPDFRDVHASQNAYWRATSDYIKALESGGVIVNFSVNGKNKVVVGNSSSNSDARIKLELIKNSLLNIKTDRRVIIVLCRYIGGLRKYAQYCILKNMGCYTDDECMKLAAEFPFAVNKAD